MIYYSIFIDTQFGGLLWFILAIIMYIYLIVYIKLYDNSFYLFAVGLPNGKKREVRK